MIIVKKQKCYIHFLDQQLNYSKFFLNSYFYNLPRRDMIKLLFFYKF